MKKLLVAILLTTSFSAAAHQQSCFAVAWQKVSETTDAIGRIHCKWMLFTKLEAENAPPEYFIDPHTVYTSGKNFCPIPATTQKEN